MRNSVNRDVALALAGRGLRIFPCINNPTSEQHKKSIAKGWLDTPLRPAWQVAALWASHFDALPAIPVGAHGLVVIDADRKPNGPDGVEAFNALCGNLGVDLSSAFVVETPSGGLHFYWRTETPYGNSRGSLPKGIDVRGHGGYVIAPGAMLPDGRSYKSVAGSWDAIPALPEPLAALLRPKVDSTAPALIQALQNVTKRERAYAQSALADEVAKLETMGEGSGRNSALNTAAHSLGTCVGAGWIERERVEQALWEAAEKNGYVVKDGDAAARATLQSGLESGIAKPRASLSLDEIPWYVPDSVAMWIEAYKAKRSQQHNKRRINLVCMDSIEEEAIEWLWQDFLPKATLVILGGAIQAGKSTIAMSLAATVTNGGLWPDGSRCQDRGNVIFWSSEEIIKSVVKPRLMAACANLRRVHTIESTLDENGDPCAFNPAQDVPLLRSAIAGLGSVSLIIIDPIISAVIGDTNKANDVRQSLQPVVNLAEEFNCTVLGIHHIAKNSEGRSTNDRLLGSQAFGAMARVVLVAAKGESDNQRVFAISKSNIGTDSGGFEYTVEGVAFPSRRGKTINTSRVVWGQRLEGSSRTILADAEGDSTNNDSSKLGEAKRYLLESLANGPVGARELIRNAREGLGISEKTLRRAKDALSITPQHDATFQGGWMWSLPLANLSH